MHLLKNQILFTLHFKMSCFLIYNLPTVTSLLHMPSRHILCVLLLEMQRSPSLSIYRSNDKTRVSKCTTVWSVWSILIDQMFVWLTLHTQAPIKISDFSYQSISIPLESIKINGQGNTAIKPHWFLSHLSQLIDNSIQDVHWLSQPNSFPVPISPNHFVLSPLASATLGVYKWVCLQRKKGGKCTKKGYWAKGGGEQRLILINDRLALRRFGQRLKLVRIDCGFHSHYATVVHWLERVGHMEGKDKGLEEHA